jgi:hypothetical protein
MHKATYEILSDGSFYGEIPGFRGVYANPETFEACREELQEVLEGWIILGLRYFLTRILRQAEITRGEWEALQIA